MSKFKVGDKVKITKAEITSKESYIGKIFTIREINPNGDMYGKKTHYGVVEPCFFVWFDNELELVKEDVYKVGDHVIATDNLGIHKNEPATIVHTIPSPKGNYWVKFNDGCELYATIHSVVEQQKKIVITTDGVKYVTAKMYEGDTVTVAEAKCAPEDTFDFMVGAKLAMERLSPKKVEPPKPTYYNGKVVCVKTKDFNSSSFTVGKVYEIVDGKFIDNDGRKRPITGDKVCSVDDLKNNQYFKGWFFQFIPFVED